jgi:hypothetical protein
MVNEHWLQLEVGLFFETLKPGLDFSSLAMEVLDGIFSQYKGVLFTLKICCLL